jgi:hypothetical protein
MGFNKRYVDSKNSIFALESNNLKGYYGKSDALIFEDSLSSKIYDLYKEGKSDKEILSIINQNMEEKTNEVY